MDLSAIKELLKATDIKATQWATAQRFYAHQLKALSDQTVILTQEALNLAQAEKVLADTIAHCSAETKNNIEAFLSLSLQQIFNNPDITIELLQEVKRDRIETQIILHDSEGSGPPNRVSGGGIQNVLGFLLRFLALRRMKMKPLLILDEAFSNVSAQYIPTLCSFLQHLTHEHGLDIMLFTHNANFFKASDIAYVLEKQRGSLIISQSFVRGINDVPESYTLPGEGVAS